jgi:hypothetical protein
MKTTIDFARSIGAVIGGYLVMMAAGVIPQFIARKIFHPAPEIDNSSYLMTMVLMNSLTGMLGGYMAAVIAGAYRFAHATVLAGIVGVISIVISSVMPRVFPQAPSLPNWYSWSVGIFVPLGILAGGWLRSRKQSPS